MRTPKKFSGVEKSEFITCSLETDSKAEAEARSVIKKAQVLADLEARLLGKPTEKTEKQYEALLKLAKSHNVEMKPVESILEDGISEVLKRLDYLQSNNVKPSSKLNDAVLGVYDTPDYTITQIAEEIDSILPHKFEAKDKDQKRTYKNRFKRAARKFTEAVSDKYVSAITKSDVYEFRRYLRETNSAEAAQKEINYLSSTIQAYYKKLKIDEYQNPAKGITIEDLTTSERKKPENRKLELSPEWISETIINHNGKLDRLNDECRDILTIIAETGCRTKEITGLPPHSIFLDAPIPYIRIQVETDEEFQRDIKTASSTRSVPLVGAALEAMKRHPDGFPRYRGNSNYSNASAKFFKENNLLPPGHHLSGLRHSYESRMIAAGISNEERAQMMGHSIGQVRGREVYGNELTLEIKALIAEMIAIPTPSFKPRSQEALREIMAETKKKLGFRLS
jgi:integrase